MATESHEHETMIPGPAASANVIAVWTIEDGILIAYGNTVPTDATSGYAIGCLFLHTDGGDATALYVNEGTASSCNFNAVIRSIFGVAGCFTAPLAEVLQFIQTYIEARQV